MSSRQSLILQDHNDLYNRKLKWILIPIILIPMVRLVIWQYYFAVEPVTGKTVFRSSDVGMTMSFIDKVPIHKFQVHSYFAMLSVLLMVLQKEMVSLKAQGSVGNLSRTIYAYFGSRIRFPPFWTIHRWFGRITLICIIVFDVTGFTLGSLSGWDHFDSVAKYVLAIPNVVFIVSVYATAKLEMWEAHRFCSNILVKAGVASPIARITASIFQKIGYWGDEFGYYYGVGAVSVLTLLLQVYEMFPDKSHKIPPHKCK